MSWGETIAEVRRQRPLVHCLTATVTMNFVADALLAAGARPMMTETVEEAPSLSRHAAALLVNLGTLSTDAMVGIPATVEVARSLGHPWVLDPVAVGAAPRRTALAHDLLTQQPGVIKGNASEIRALAGIGKGGSGPDATDEVTTARLAAARLAEQTGAVIATTGPTDLITTWGEWPSRASGRGGDPSTGSGNVSSRLGGVDPATGSGNDPSTGSGTVDGSGAVDEAYHHGLELGHPLLARVTGSGCALGALIAACVAVSTPVTGTLAALQWMNRAGEQAAALASGPGSFRVHLLDALDSFDPGSH